MNAPEKLWLRLASGRLTEVSGLGGGGGLSFALFFVRALQRRGESVVWLSSPAKPFYPPDAERAGVDLSRLPLIFLREPEQASLAATKLLSSGGFGLLVWDLVSWKKPPKRLPVAFLGRLNSMARHFRSTVLLLTDKPMNDASLGCLVGLRFQVEAQEGAPEHLEVQVVKDKRGVIGEGKSWDWRCELPDGLSSSSGPASAGSMSTANRVVEKESRLA